MTNLLNNLKTLKEKILSDVDMLLTFWLLRIMDILGYTAIGGIIRPKVLKFFGFNIGNKVRLGCGLRLFKRADKVIIKDYAGIGHHVYIDAMGPVEFGEYCMIGFNTTFITSKHNLRSSLKGHRNITSAPIVVGNHAWIASHCIILPGVTIGTGSIVAAGSVVSKDVPPHCIVSGNPAVVIKEFRYYKKDKNKVEIIENAQNQVNIEKSAEVISIEEIKNNEQ